MLLNSQTYIAHSAGPDTIYPEASYTEYANPNGTGGRMTSFTYTWYPSTLQMLSKTTTLPRVAAGQNGSDAAGSTVDSSISLTRNVPSTTPRMFIRPPPRASDWPAGRRRHVT